MVKMPRAEAVALVLILLLAALLRLLWPTLTEFKLDEAQITAQAWDLAELKSFPLHGTRSSIGMYLPPFGIYLYALPLLIWPNPLAAVVFTALCNVLAVGLCWWVGRRYWGPAAGLGAALWLATTPWAIAFSRKIWEPDLLPLLSLGYLIAGLLAFVERRPWALAAHLLLLAVIVQVHFSGAVLIPLTLLLLIRYRRSVRWRPLALGLGLAALSAVPFLVYLWRARGEVRAALSGLLVSQPSVIDGQALRLWRILAVGSQIHSLAGPRAFREYLAAAPDLEPVRLAASALLVAGLGYWLWLALRRPADRAAQSGGIIALWSLAPLLVFTRHAMPLHAHYFLVSLPAASLVLGCLAARALALRQPAWRWMAGVAFVGVAAANAAAFVMLLSFVGSRSNAGGFGVPLRAQVRAVQAARRLGETVVVLSPGDDPACDEWAAVFAVHLRRAPHRLVNGTRAALFPATSASILATPGVSEALGVYEKLGALAVPPDPAAGPFRVSRLVRQPALALRDVGRPRRLANGVEFVGYQVSGRAAPQQSIDWWVAWRVRDLLPNRAADYHIYNHLLDAKGSKWAQADAGTVRARDWEQGDVVVQMFRLDIPPQAASGPYWMQVGMYSYPELQGQPVVDAPPGLAAAAVSCGPIAAP